MRAVYGPLLGVGWTFVRDAASRSPAPAGLVLGVGVLGFEFASFPRLSAAESLRGWSAAAQGGLVAQTAAYCLVTEATLSALGAELASGPVLEVGRSAPSPGGADNLCRAPRESQVRYWPQYDADKICEALSHA